MNDDELMEYAKRLQNAATARLHNDDWNHSIAAIGRRAGANAAQVIADAQNYADPVAALHDVGLEILRQEASDGRRESEEHYAEWRERQRQAWRKSKGLVR
jgi:hypothetical protein